MSTFSGIAPIAPSDTWTNSSTDIGMVLGQIAVTPDGRYFRYGLAGAVNLATSKLNQAPALTANLQNMTTATAAIGDGLLTVTPGGSITITANQYAGGFVIVNAGTGLGQMLQISSHAAQTASTAAFNLNLISDDTVKLVTAVADTKSSVMSSTYKNVIIQPTTGTGAIAGVNPYAITAAQYGFFQTMGLASVLSDVSIAGANLAIAPSTTTAGAVTVAAATTNQIGYAAQAGVSAEYRYVILNIA